MATKTIEMNRTLCSPWPYYSYSSQRKNSLKIPQNRILNDRCKLGILNAMTGEKPLFQAISGTYRFLCIHGCLLAISRSGRRGRGFESRRFDSLAGGAGNTDKHRVSGIFLSFSAIENTPVFAPLEKMP